MSEHPPFRRISSHCVYRSNWMALRADVIEDREGFRSEYGVVERKDFVLIIPVCAGDVLMVRQYRYPIQAWTLEFPQGAVESNEDPPEAARRELAEETGAEAGELVQLGRVYEASGYATHSFEVYVTKVQAVTAPRLEHGEQGMMASWVPIARVREIIRNGNMRDASSLAAWALAVERGFLPE